MAYVKRIRTFFEIITQRYICPSLEIASENGRSIGVDPSATPDISRVLVRVRLLSVAYPHEDPDRPCW